MPARFSGLNPRSDGSLARLAGYHVEVTGIPVVREYPLSVCQGDGSRRLVLLRVHLVISHVEADFVVNVALDQVLLPGAHYLPIHLGVVWFRPKILRILGVAAILQ